MMQYDGVEGSQKNKVCVAVRFRPLRCGPGPWRRVGACCRLHPLAREPAAAAAHVRGRLLPWQPLHPYCADGSRQHGHCKPPRPAQPPLVPRSAVQVPCALPHPPCAACPALPPCSDKERGRGDHEVWECAGNAVGILEDVGMKARWGGGCWAGVEAVRAVRAVRGP